MTRTRDLSGARVLLTGAAGGIGSATAHALRSRGARVAGVDLRPEGDLIQADVSNEGSARAAVAAAVDRLGGLDVLVNSAGIARVQDTGFMPDEDTFATLQVNLFGTWRMTSAALPHLLASRGQVVIVASALAWISIPFSAAYCVSKRALTAYADALRIEYAGGLEVATVYPGYVRTAIHDSAHRAGLSLGDAIRDEPVEAVAAAIVRACQGGCRDIATTRRVAIVLALARHAPRLLERLQIRRMRRRVLAGAFEGSALAAEFRKRLSSMS